jgi:tetratricopeptide (TPR) repeat protein
VVGFGVSLCALACGGPNGAQPSAPVAPGTPVVAASATASHVASTSYGTIASDAPPISLTTEDGNGLALASMDAKVVVEGPLAFTELHLRFTNPDARVREGRFAITLPSGAAVDRFAMNVDGKWMEAEMVERSVARRAYEDFLHRKTDPALLEKQAGNQFAARVFPIPARADKELILSYAQELGDGPYVLPLRGLPSIGAITASARVLRAGAGGWDETTLDEHAWQPDRDFTVGASGRPQAVASGELVAARVVPDLGVGAAPVASATILVDDSASRALGWDRTVDDLGALIAALARDQHDPRIAVAAFDQEVAPIYEGAASKWGAAEAATLRARGALGASDLAAALAWAKAHGAHDRVVIVTDGVATAGDGALGAAAAAIGAARVDVVLAGGIRDEQAARAIAHGGAVLDLGAGAGEVARRIGLATTERVAVKVDGAMWVWPQTVEGLQPGDGATIYAALGASARGKAISISIGDRAVTVTPASAPRALVERAAAEANVLRLEASAAATTDAKARADAKAQVVALSIKERVLSDETALLVLETDADYARYGLDRRALADILVVGKDGLTLAHRDAPIVIAQPVTARADGRDGKDKGKEERKKTADAVTVVDKVVSVDGDDDGEASGELGDEAPGTPAPIADPAPEYKQVPANEPAPSAPPPPPEPPRVPRVDDDRNGYADEQRQLTLAETGATAQREAGRSNDRGDDDGGGSEADDDDAHDAMPPWTGDYNDVMIDIGAGRAAAALDRARAWHAKDPGDVLGLVALGDALEATGDRAGAARAYGSIIDLFPARADLRRFAGERLERIADRDPSVSRALVLDTYRKAVDDRPDHLTGHRLYAYALVRAGRYAEALAAIERGLDQKYPADRFRGGDRILREDLGLVGGAWAAAEPARKKEIAARIATRGGALTSGATTRFVLYWETDDNDVDFHIHDAHGGHAFYKRMHLRSGGDLYADVTTGYGPEEFALDGGGKAGPYQLQIHYFARGPMGYGMGTLEILHRDSRGALSFEHRPFIVMNDKAYVDLGSVKS